MTLHVNPIVFGVMLVVTIGSVIYGLLTEKRRQRLLTHSSNRPSPHFDIPVNPGWTSSGTSRRKSSAQSSQNKEIYDNCSICLESLEPLRTLPCGHVFHTDCVKGWVNSNNTCPLCRGEAN